MRTRRIDLYSQGWFLPPALYATGYAASCWGLSLKCLCSTVADVQPEYPTSKNIWGKHIHRIHRKKRWKQRARPDWENRIRALEAWFCSFVMVGCVREKRDALWATKSTYLLTEKKPWIKQWRGQKQTRTHCSGPHPSSEKAWECQCHTESSWWARTGYLKFESWYLKKLNNANLKV